MIPARLIRFVRGSLDPVFEDFWSEWQAMHPSWEHVTVRDPLEPDDWPLTGHRFAEDLHVVQVSDLVRLESLHRWGGVYVDTDFQALRPIDDLLASPGGCFVGDQGGGWVCTAMMGATAGHPAIRACIDRVLALPAVDGVLGFGPANITAVLPGRPDVTVLEREVIYPYLWTEPQRRHENFLETSPRALAVHHWAGSWLG